ncbi:SMI1/KNR4 family protein [Macrococcoides canis]|uniref:SMI1/KNR4 family protein n=1 Tax=Macrococcoides canis TaxID=1855823 RepID=UPI0020B650E8|nr:SMI1/KNR4 family protein [Macrococcus canis]UTH01514.1 SMI1/KNR4 family protein [Macrococcus canis]
MNINNLDKILSKGKTLDEKSIVEFEKWRGIKLPNDFVEFNLKYPYAYMEGTFDADDRPFSSIHQILNFDREDIDTIYKTEIYGISDLGPYVLFACDAGGNYLAFDYSNDKLNPSVVFIDHEELGVIELPDGKSENDFTEEELDRMMSSEKLVDYPWAIHFVAATFTNFMNLIVHTLKKGKYTLPEYKTNSQNIEVIETTMNVKLPEVYKTFFKKYGGVKTKVKEIYMFDKSFKLLNIYSGHQKEHVNTLRMINLKGGKDKYKNLIPIISIINNSDKNGISVIALYFKENFETEIVIIPHEVFNNKENINRDDLIFLTNEIEKFFDKMIQILEF